MGSRMVTPFEHVDAELIAHGCDPKRRGTHIDAKCPAHDDRNPSLSVDERPGTVVLYCHAGCDLPDIIAALELEARDLYDETYNDKPQIDTVYDYVNASGTLLFQVVRMLPKSFPQRRPDGHGGWIWNLKGVERVPYRLPELIEGVRTGRHILIVEGEKDVDRVIRERFVSTCNSGGAGKFDPKFAHYFKGAKIAVLADNDEPGRQHAESVARNLVDVAAVVKVIELPRLAEHGDVSDWLANGGTAVN